MQSKKAFTLIELLVVISIIALLVAILMPALSKAKRMATGSVCLNNQRGLSTAWMMYAQDNDDKIVSAYPWYNPANQVYGWVAQPSQAKNEAGAIIWSSDFASQVLAKKKACEQGAIWTYIETIEMFHCPGDKREFRRNTGTKKHAFRTYSLPHGLNSDHSFGVKDLKTTTNIKSPASKICFVEEDDPRGWNGNHWTQDPYDLNNWGDTVAIWHGDSSTFSFCDGHAEMKRWEDPITIQMAEEGRCWGNTIPSPGSPDIAWVKRHYPHGGKS